LPAAAQGRDRQRAFRSAPPEEVPLPLARLVSEIASQQLQVRADLPRVIGQSPWRIAVAEDRGLSRAEYPGLLPADRLAVLAEKRLVVQVHAGDDGAIGIDDVHGVEP